MPPIDKFGRPMLALCGLGFALLAAGCSDAPPMTTTTTEHTETTTAPAMPADPALAPVPGSTTTTTTTSHTQQPAPQ